MKFHFTRSFVLLLILSVGFVWNQNSTCQPDGPRTDCGFFTQGTCETNGCCWNEVNPNPDNLPFCYQPGQFCDPSATRTDCAPGGISESGCIQKGCCYYPVNPNPQNLPWCFGPNFVPLPPPPPPGTPPFSDEEVQTMMTFFLDNIDVENCGAVAASPDKSIGYYFNWMRDAALSMRTLMIVNNDTDLVNSKMQQYVSWVLNIQNKNDDNVDVRVEPKFDIPSGDPYSGGWCRPQTDGPGIRGGTLALYSLYLLNNSGDTFVKQYLWTGSQSIYNGGAVKYDLDWVAQNWESNGCDLWEEVQSDDFFWNRYNFRYGLTVGAMVAEKMGDSDTATLYQNTANSIKETLLAHYNGQFVYESTNRPKDAAVINAFNNGYLDDGFFAPTDESVSGTINVLNDLFNGMFPLNGYDTEKGLPGIFYGRYEGDIYQGGNPWILTTAALAQLYYAGAITTLKEKSLPSEASMKNFRAILNLPDEDLTYTEFAQAVVQAGDDVLYRIKYHVNPYGLHLAEQLDKVNGIEVSAPDLTWSYACVLKAMHYRTQAQSGLI
mmetsp:Transcript_43627/g.61314  ORF Transcript_43627/g.61314 Transcript_43627/m.61314 type:complete len:548 (+) Transcript_43627:16-1659(+)